MRPIPERPLAERDVVLLDAGGTLITMDYDRVRLVLGPSGCCPADDELDRAEADARRWADAVLRGRLAPRELWDGYFTRLMTGVGVPSSAVPGALDALWTANRDVGLWRRPVPGARAALERLRVAGRRMAVVSNAEGQVEADLADAGFGEFLETVVDSHVVGVAKPDPRIFGIAMERLGVTPERCVYVGDVPAFDVAGAQASGIPPVLLDPHGLYADLVPDVVRIGSIRELPGVLGLTD